MLCFIFARLVRPAKASDAMLMAARHCLSHTLVQTGLFREQAYIGGSWLNASTGKTFDITNPAENSLLGRCAE
ncbi:hypothetical protein BDW62DRAFT_202442 [Aspergillus aurantiobrunneus]